MSVELSLVWIVLSKLRGLAFSGVCGCRFSAE